MKDKIVKIVKFLASELSDRSKDIIFMRYGIKDGKKHSFQEIGDNYGITRERVRQLEEISHKKMYKKYQENDPEVIEFFEHIHSLIEQKGGLMHEDKIIEELGLSQKERFPLKLILFLHNNLYRTSESLDFKLHWFTQEKTSKIFNSVMKNIHRKVKPIHGVYTEEDMIGIFLKEFSSVIKKNVSTHKTISKDKSMYWLSTSKRINSNLLGEWGHIDCDEISLKNVNAKAALILRKNNGPMHFLDITKKICSLTGKKVNNATCHNELVRSDRFVLLGRGKYGLSSTVKYTSSLENMVEDIVRRENKISIKDLIKRVSMERDLKDATIVRFLFDKKKYLRNKEGLYSLISQ